MTVALSQAPVNTGEGNVNGFGLEFYIETPADEVSETIHDIKQSWQFQLLYTVSQLAAGEAKSYSGDALIRSAMERSNDCQVADSEHRSSAAPDQPVHQTETGALHTLPVSGTSF